MQGNGRDRTSFSKGYALYAFDLTLDLGEDDHFNLGRVQLASDFGKRLREAISCHLTQTSKESA